MANKGNQWREGVEAALNAIAGNFGGGGDSQEARDRCDGVEAARASARGIEFKWPPDQSPEFLRGWNFGELVELTRQELLD